MVVLSSFPPPTEGIKLVQPCGAFINARNLGQGTLYIAERYTFGFHFLISDLILKVV